MNDLDELLSLDPLSLTSDDARLDEIIAYYRKWRKDVAGGAKAQKDRGDPKGKVDLEKLGLVPQKVETPRFKIGGK